MFLNMTTAAEATTATELESAIETIADLPTSKEEVGSYFQKIYEMLAEYAVTYGGKIILSAVILIIGFKLIKLFTKKMTNVKGIGAIDNSTRSFLYNVIGVVLKVLLIITVLAILGVPMASMVAVIGSCGLAIGLALQGSLGNIAGGFILMITKPFKVGDFIECSGKSGTVEDIGLFYTTITTSDNRRITVPNNSISNDTLINMTAEKNRRVDLVFTASYNSDTEKVKRTLLSVAERHELILKEPASFARMSAHGDSAVEYTFRAWCKTEDYWTVYYDMIENVKKAFDENCIEIPFPQVDVHGVEQKPVL